MNDDSDTEPRGGKKMEYLVPLGILALVILFQVWLLPKMGFRS
jgi:hypothetical protein